MTDHTDTTFLVITDTDRQTSYRVVAAHVGVDERIFPGWTLLKNASGTIVAMVRSERALLIQRIDETAAVPAVKSAPPGAPSPATIAQVRPPAAPSGPAVTYTTSSARP